jgi:uncharacterized cofD-like protein
VSAGGSGPPEGQPEHLRSRGVRAPGPGSSGPNVVALGGGHGLAASLRAAKGYAGKVMGIVSVADDGGSSGRLRLELGAAPPGDLRKCLVALGDDRTLWSQALEHRFGGGDLQGHPLGNLLIVGLAEVTGDLQAALDEVGRLAGAGGRVVPATTCPVELSATAGGKEVFGQAAIAQATGITRLSVIPGDPGVPPAALEAIGRADQVVLGPGSLFTSVLAVAVVPAIKQALAEAPGQVVYVCNLRAEPGETAGYDVARHVDALLAHGARPDVVLCDPTSIPLGSPKVPWVERPLHEAGKEGHSAVRLGAALEEVLRMSGTAGVGDVRLRSPDEAGRRAGAAPGQHTSSAEVEA